MQYIKIIILNNYFYCYLYIAEMKKGIAESRFFMTLYDSG